MSDIVNINVQQDNDIVNIVSSQINEVIDVNVGQTVEEVTFNITEEIIQVNINKVTGGGGEQTLAETLVLGNNTGGTDILLNNDDAIQLENNSSIRKGTYDFGQQGGISRICGVGFEDMWQGGIRHVFDGNGFIRNSTNCFNIIPNNSFDITLRFKVGSIWTLDDETNYICTDATELNAVWELYNVIPTNTSDLTNDSNFIVDADYTHTDNNFTDTLKTKLDGIADGAEVNVNADWNATSGDAEILNKPSIPAAQIQSDWTQATTSALDYIKNKPIIPSISGLELQANKQNSLATDGTGVKYPTVDAVNSGLSSVNTNSIRRDTVKLSEAINKGQAVYVSGANGTNILVSKASNASEATSSKTIGLLETTGAINAIVNVVTDGLLTGLDTSTATIGDPVWLGVNGDLIYGLANEPYAPAHLVYIGVVTRVNLNNGEILVKIQNGYKLSEIHDVAITSVADKQILTYDSATSLWKNKSLNQIVSERRNANNSLNNNINYCGTAANGSSESATVWTIKRLTIAASGSITIATATNVAWTNRQSATYI